MAQITVQGKTHAKLKRESKKRGMTLAGLVEMLILNGWKSFKEEIK
jgi:hypothetical protein